MMNRIKKNTLPTFICIGAQRAGTTWLYHCLKEHPEIYMPVHKELRFFNYNYDEGIDSYSRNFDDAGERNVIGEITPDYYRQQYALLRINEHIPDVKLIFILRNPIDRAFSQYQLYCGTEYKEMTFKETYIKHSDLVDWGKYGEHLEFIYQHFPKDNVLVIEYDLLKGAPEEFLKQIFEFLNVSQDYKPTNLAKTYNKVIYPRAQKILRNFGFQFIIESIKKSRIGDWIRNEQKNNKSDIAKQDFDYLVKSFSKDVKKLGSILNADFTHWLRR